jgi:hypothetical protein
LDSLLVDRGSNNADELIGTTNRWFVAHGHAPHLAIDDMGDFRR